MQVSHLVSKKTIIINSILFEKIILDPFYGFFFHQSYPKLAEDSLSIIIRKEDNNVLDFIDACLDEGFNIASLLKMEPIDLWAAHNAIGGAVSGRLLSKALNEKNPVRIFKELREFYEKKPVKTFKSPASDSEYETLNLVDEKTEDRPRLKTLEFKYLGKNIRKDVFGANLCVWDISLSKVFSSYGYAYIPSHPFSILPGYSKILLKMDKKLKENAKLSEAFKVSSAEESLKYLLGDKVGELNELLGFAPLNILQMVSRQASNEQVDGVALRIRKDCKKVRELVEKVHVNCLKKEIDKAIDSKMKLADMKANQLINYSILDNTSEFMNKETQDVIHGFVDKMLEEEMKSIAVKLHKPLKKLKKRLGWISEAKFLTFGTLLLLASRGVDTPYIEELFTALGYASLGSGAVGVASRIIEEGMKLYPGFNIYTTFINWPKIA
jgi:hypothetical protein